MIEAITQFFIISALIIFGIALIVCLFRLIKGLQRQIELFHLMRQVRLSCLL